MLPYLSGLLDRAVTRLAMGIIIPQKAWRGLRPRWVVLPAYTTALLVWQRLAGGFVDADAASSSV